MVWWLILYLKLSGPWCLVKHYLVPRCLVKHYLGVYLWECFWMRLTFLWVAYVMKISLPPVGGPCPITWRPEKKRLSKRELLLHDCLGLSGSWNATLSFLGSQTCQLSDQSYNTGFPGISFYRYTPLFPFLCRTLTHTLMQQDQEEMSWVVSIKWIVQVIKVSPCRS